MQLSLISRIDRMEAFIYIVPTVAYVAPSRKLVIVECSHIVCGGRLARARLGTRATHAITGDGHEH
jgi:hypothetical protein